MPLKLCFMLWRQVNYVPAASEKLYSSRVVQK
jgi:hypothetical protein